MDNNMKKTALFEIACPSTEIEGEPCWSGDSLVFKFFSEGKISRDGVMFTAITAMRKRTERCCTAWHIEGFYDTVCEVEDSDWVREIRHDLQPQFLEKWHLNHYGIYLDSYGCLEVIAHSWKRLDRP
jgi:hypothetical protein